MSTRSAARASGADPARQARLPGLLLGIGLGGFVDGIVLHQILQWHHLLSSAEPVTTVAGLRLNTLWDGLFHAVAWVAVLAGLAVLSARTGRSGGRAWASRVLWGWMLAGWGFFNLVEGILNHHLLGIHHVVSGPYQLVADLGFLAFGALLLAGGWLLQRSGGHAKATRAG